MGEKPEKEKIVVPHLNLEEMKSSTFVTSSLPSSPGALRKMPSAKYNCLCSPTTHAGSFRCRYHRNPTPTSHSMSVGSKLSELASVSAKLSEFESKPSRMCDQLHAQ